ncbi:MAG TPA: hypothetical protein VG738_03075 [Chitinophagaceae bacterium]|nr:hypothetical protein [Chitinophagaceae bacterium]
MPLNRQRNRLLLVLFIIAVCFACTPPGKITKENFDSTKEEAIYKAGLDDAKNMTEAKVSHKLTEVIPANKNITQVDIDTFKVLVVSWKDSADLNYYNSGKKGYFNTGGFVNFVTIAPDLLKWYESNHPDSAVLDYRLKELLGLPPTAKKNCFMLFWVKAADLYRPCKDSSITDNYCNIDFPPGTGTGYIKWWTDYFNGSYSSTTLYKNYPFTGLGYTYDWSPANKSHKGLSEFCIKANSTIYFNSYASTKQFFANK